MEPSLSFCIRLSRSIVHACVLSRFSHDWLLTTLQPDCSPPGSSAHGILQARMLEWVAMPFSRESSRPRYQTFVSCIAGRFCTIWATNEALKSVIWPCICPVLFIYNTLFSIWQKLIILWLLHTCMKNEFRYSDEQKVFLTVWRSNQKKRNVHVIGLPFYSEMPFFELIILNSNGAELGSIH